MKTRTKILNCILVGSLITLLTPFKYIDNELKLYHNRFKDILYEYCTKDKINNPNQIIIKFGNLEDNMVGLCELYPKRFVITFDISYWKKLSNNGKEILSTHEFTHCYLDIGHSEDNNNFMYKYLNPDISLTELHDQMVKVLKEHCK